MTNNQIHNRIAWSLLAVLSTHENHLFLNAHVILGSKLDDEREEYQHSFQGSASSLIDSFYAFTDRNGATHSFTDRNGATHSEPYQEDRAFFSNTENRYVFAIFDGHGGE